MRKGIAIAAVAVLLLILACTPSGGPVVSITAPHNGDTLNHGVITIKAHATDNTGVTKVEFYVGGTLKTTDSAGVADTFRGNWDASSETNGAYTLKAKAYNTGGKTGENSISVTLAGGQSIHSSDITSDSIWYPAGNPHIIDADIEVHNNAKLTIMPGCLVKFNTGYELSCGYTDPGAIIAVGKADSTILFTSNAASPAPGDWNKIGMYSNTMPTTQFAYCSFEYGGPTSGSDGEIYVSSNKVAKIDHCTIRHSGNYGITFQGINSSLASFTANTVTTCAKYPVDIYPPNVGILVAGNTLTGNATGFDGVLVEGGTGPNGVIANATWVSLGVPYILNNDVEVDAASGPVLTIEPGTTIKLANDAEFYCGYADPGAISAIGTSGSPIIITSRLASPAPGSWTDVGFYSQATNQSGLQYCTIEYGGSNANGGDIKISNTAAPVIQSCAINNSGSWGIWLEGPPYPDPFQLEANNTFSNCPSGHIWVPPVQ